MKHARDTGIGEMNDSTIAAIVKLLAVEADLVFTDEQDYQQAIALGLVCFKAGFAQSRDGETS